MAEKRFFLHLDNDHRGTKNKLSDETREYFRKRFNHTITDNLPDTVGAMRATVNLFNDAHRRCKPLRGEHFLKRDYPGSSDIFYIPDLFTIHFYEVREEVDNG